MNKSDKTRIILKLIEMAKEVKKFLSLEENQVYPPYRSTFLLVSSFDEEREEILVKLLNDEVYAAMFSEEYLEKLLKEKVTSMMETLRQQEPPHVRPQVIAKETAEAIFNELDTYATRITVYLPVSGIDLQLDEGKLEIGNITLQKMTPQKADELQNKIRSDIMANSHSPETKEALIQHFTKDLQRLVEEKNQPVYAIYHIAAEPIQAEKRAKEECYKAFDLLRYALPYISSLYPMGFSIPKKYLDNDKVETNKFARRGKKAQVETRKSIYFGLETEIGASSEIISDIIMMREPSFLIWKSSRHEHPHSFRINTHTIEGLKRAKVFEASTIIQKEDASQTNFERCILRSIHWFANAQIPMQPEYVLMSLMSSIEAFLNPPHHENVTAAIVEGAAALGGKQGYTYTKKRIDKLYDKRSALSHGDRAEIMERDISEIRAIAFYLIHQMLQSTDEFTTQEQFYKEVVKLREEIKHGNTKTNPMNNPQEEVD